MDKLQIIKKKKQKALIGLNILAFIDVVFILLTHNIIWGIIGFFLACMYAFVGYWYENKKDKIENESLFIDELKERHK